MTLNELIVSLCGLPTVSGSERRSTEALRGLIGAAFDEMQVDALGNHLFIKRCGRQDAPKILIDTHLDEIGMMVNGYRDGGFLTVANVGGVDTRILPAGEVVIYGKETLYGVVAAEPAHLLPAADAEKLKPITEMVIDTGYSKEELEALAEVCLRHDIYIVADEIYYRLCYDGRKFTSVAALGEEVKKHTIIINGVSKSYSMTGWRCGFAACGDKRIAKVMTNCLSHALGNIGAMNQAAMAEAMRGPQDSVEEMRKVFEERRNYLVERMNKIDGVSCLKPDGAFYVMMNLEKLIGRTLGGRVIHNADDFAMAFLEKGLVAVVSCCAFDAPNFVRWTYATSLETIKEGLDRLEKFLKEG